MSVALIIVILTLVTLLFIGAPVVLAIGTSGMVYFLVKPGMFDSMNILVHNFYTGMDSFVFLAIPLFILTGELMNIGGMMDKLVRFCQLLVGGLRGGLAYVNILGSMLFGGVSGSGLADVSALGPIQVRMMEKDGYKREFAAALTATSALQGPIIPPSIPFVIFASLTNVSVGALFLGGIIPGILLGLVQMIVVFFMAKKRNFPKNYEKVTWKQALSDTVASLYALFLPVIILGGMLSGLFTATEAAAIAAAYSFIITAFVYRNLTIKNFSQALINTARVTGSIFLIIAFTGVISWILSIERVPGMINSFMSDANLSPVVLLLLVNVFFLINGMWLSDVAQLLLFAPIFTPIFIGLGVDPIHFGIIMVVNVMISMITPPYGTALYLASAISDSKLTAIVKEGLPFLVACLLILLLITLVPGISLFLPKLFGAM
ncbi:TRAP transporter large permease [Pseudalkalibacillus sp. A8]|uniref:TRAP transporter large permease n=1 Tax=Pseudalkalibacillus sp. A8 TaxID=3382641 RepID=UPI0038B5BC24